MNKQYRLQRIETSWYQRARVRCHDLFDKNNFDTTKLDFLPCWLPFGEHPDYQKLSEHQRHDILSIAWLLYNQATIDIERILVVPFCLRTVDSHPHFRDDFHWRQLLFQTITDESYHVLLTEHASEITREKRGLGHIKIPTSFVIHTMEQTQQDYASEWQKELIALATCIVTEIVIGEHLGVVAKTKDQCLQPLVTETTKTHMLDESTHSFVFKQILEANYTHFTSSQRAFFNTILPKIIAWFLTGKLAAWKQLFPSLQIKNGQDILADCAQIKPETLSYDFSDLITIADEFGLRDLEDKIWDAL